MAGTARRGSEGGGGQAGGHLHTRIEFIVAPPAVYDVSGIEASS